MRNECFVLVQNFESTLKSWEDKKRSDSYGSSRPRLNSQQSMEYLSDEECAQVQQLGIVADTLINRCVCVCVFARGHLPWPLWPLCSRGLL